MSHFGVDVSSNNPHPINWAALYAYLHGEGGEQPFAIIKVTQGTGYVDPFAAEDFAAARAAGFAIGGYLMDQGNDDPTAEESLFHGNAIGIPQFDDDELPEGLSDEQYIEHLTQLILQDPSALQYLNQSEVASGYPQGAGLWLAEYNNQPGVTSSPCLIQQYTDAGTPPGCEGSFDLNYFCGTETQFASIFHLAPPVEPTPEIFKKLSGKVGTLNEPVVAQVDSPTGDGYTLIGADGGTFNYGDAKDFGSLANKKLNAPIVNGCLNKTNTGLYLVGTDGGVFCLGAAAFYGSAAGKPLNQPIVSINVTSTGNGYRLTAADGGVFCYGDAKFLGSPA